MLVVHCVVRGDPDDVPADLISRMHVLEAQIRAKQARAAAEKVRAASEKARAAAEVNALDFEQLMEEAEAALMDADLEVEAPAVEAPMAADPVPGAVEAPAAAVAFSYPMNVYYAPGAIHVEPPDSSDSEFSLGHSDTSGTSASASGVFKKGE